MKKVFLIGWKDLTLAFRDRAAIILMLLAPFVLTLGLGFVTGSFSGESTGISNIPVTLVNQDDGALGAGLVNLFQSADLADLVAPQVLDDPAAARRAVDEDKASAAVIIPAGFSAGIIPDRASGKTQPGVEIEVYANPTRPTNASVIQTIVERYLSQVEMGRIGGQVTVTQLLESGRIQPGEAAQVGAQIGAQQAQAGERITLKGVAGEKATVEFNILAYMAPGMALMFLMFAVSNGGRTLLMEKTQGTLPRLLVSPVRPSQALLGKMFGIFLTGTAQMLILILASTLIFGLQWGDPLAVLVLVLSAVVGAVGWGMLITALAQTPNQAGSIGSAVMLIFGILGGSFFDIGQFPTWFRAISRITPNAWGLDGFTTLALGGGLADILPVVAGLLAMGAVLFAVSVVIFNRRGILRH